jgi:hypothetical protein
MTETHDAARSADTHWGVTQGARGRTAARPARSHSTMPSIIFPLPLKLLQGFFSLAPRTASGVNGNTPRTPSVV